MSDKEKKREYNILLKCKAFLEDGKSLRNLDLDSNEINSINHLNLITIKALIYVANIDESLISEENNHIKNLNI